MEPTRENLVPDPLAVTTRQSAMFLYHAPSLQRLIPDGVKSFAGVFLLTIQFKGNFSVNRKDLRALT